MARRELYDAFCARYEQVNEKLGKKQYLIPYLMSSHPGSDLNAAIELACYLRDIGLVHNTAELMEQVVRQFLTFKKAKF